jgi:archaemetzincin
MKKNSTLKTLVNLFIFIAVFAYVVDILKQNNYDLYEFADNYDKEHKLGKYSEGESSDIELIPEKEEYIPNKPTSEKKLKASKKIIYVHGFGEYNYQDLISIKNGVEDFYGFEVIIGEPYTNITDDYFIDGSENLNPIRVLEDSENIGGHHIYVTNHPLYIDGRLISGWGRYYHNSCVVSSYQLIKYRMYNDERMMNVANHELGHNFGLSHCENQSCLMKFKVVDNKDFCDNCKRMLNQ